MEKLYDWPELERPAILTFIESDSERVVILAPVGCEAIPRRGRIPKKYAELPRYTQVTAFKRVK